MAKAPRVVIIDDGQAYAELLAHMPEFELLRPHGALRLPDGPAALQWLAVHRSDTELVLLDVQFDIDADRLLPLDQSADTRRTRRFQGVAILREIRRRWPDLPVVLLTAQEDLALTDAAHDVSATPLTYYLGAADLDTLRIRIAAALAEAAQPLEDGGILWGHDLAMRALRRRLAVVAQGGLPVVIEGETGTGKSHLARQFVHANSGRKGPFVAVDLATVPAELIAAHLFGALRGSYTGAVADRKGAFQAADGGTLFLDELQNTTADVQKLLLRALQEGRVTPLGAVRDEVVDVKVVVASNLPLQELVATGRLRADLYMRLSPATRVVVPALRHRPQDLGFLLRRLTQQCALKPAVAQLRMPVLRALGLAGNAPIQLVFGADARRPAQPGVLELALPESAWRALQSHPWPGNLRELAMLAENLVTFTLFSAVEALRAGMELHQTRMQVDGGFVNELLGKTAPDESGETPLDGQVFRVSVQAGATLNQVAVDLERQVLRTLFARHSGDFAAMAQVLLGDPARQRAVRLRLNQLGLSARALRRDA